MKYKGIEIPTINDLVTSIVDENILVHRKNGVSIDLIRKDELSSMSTEDANAKIERLMKNFIDSCETYRRTTLNMLISAENEED
jgi:hypothetical protein